MAFDANTIHGALLANQAATCRETECRSIHLPSVGGIDVDVEQARGRRFRFEAYAVSFGGLRFIIDTDDDARPQQIPDFHELNSSRKHYDQPGEAPMKKRLRTGRRFVGARNVQGQNQSRPMTLAQGLDEGFLASVPRRQETKA